MYLFVQLGLSLHLNLVNLGKGLSKDRQNDIKQEERADNNQHDREEDGHPSDSCILQIVHDLCPAFQRDHLKHSNEPDGEVVERADSKVDQLIVFN